MILKRGRIKNRDEYELVHSRIDELIHNVPSDDPGQKDILELGSDLSRVFNCKDQLIWQIKKGCLKFSDSPF